MWYYRRLTDGIIVMQTRPEHAEQLEALQRTCFPTLDDAERFKAAHYRKHIELFPDGQFVALDGDTVVGRDHDAAPRLRLRAHRSHVRRHHPGRLADVARAERRLALWRGHRRRSRVSRTRHRHRAVRGAAGSGLAPRPARSGHRRHDSRLRRRQGDDDRRGLLRGCRRRTHHRSDAVDAAAGRFRTARAPGQLPQRSGLRQLQRPHRARRRAGIFPAPHASTPRATSVSRRPFPGRAPRRCSRAARRRRPPASAGRPMSWSSARTTR